MPKSNFAVKASLDIDVRGQSVDADALDHNVHPYDVWEFYPDSDPPVLELPDPWKLKVAELEAGTLEVDDISIGNANCLGLPYAYYYEILSTDPSDTNWHAVDVPTVSGCPSDIMAIFCYAYAASTAPYSLIQISNESAGDPYLLFYPAASAPSSSAQNPYGICPVDASKQIWWQCASTTVTLLTIRMTAYFRP